MTLDARSNFDGELRLPNAMYIRLPGYPLLPLSMNLASRAITPDNVSALQSQWNSLTALAMRWLSPARVLICRTPGHA